MTDRGLPGVRRLDNGLARQLVIMVKEPVAGRAKTRLARDVGVSSAMRFYRHTLAAVVSRLSKDPRWRTSLSVAPATALATRSLPSGVARLPQSSGDLGRKMQQIFGAPGTINRPPGRAATAAPGHGPVVIIGTDIPQVCPQHIAAAFDALGNHDVVFGPASDGGFWLVGMRRTPRILDAFQSVRWSTSETLRDCLDGLAGQHVAMAETLRDVDDWSDVQKLGRIIGRRLPPTSMVTVSGADRAAIRRAVNTAEK
jgi:rSAM/selenodomain-associated transferase 1